MLLFNYGRYFLKNCVNYYCNYKALIPNHINSEKKFCQRNFGFTLVEVLITLFIVGIVAALTIPILMQNSNDRTTVAALKKAYSILSSAYILAEQESGTPENWNLIANVSPQGGENILNTLAPYLSLTKKCGRASGCFPPEKYKYLNGSDYLSYDSDIRFAKAQLADGSVLLVYVIKPLCDGAWGTSEALNSACGYAVIDTNGSKKPNQVGNDTFHFYLTKKGFIPAGTPADTQFTFSGECKNKTTAAGFSCAAWVLSNENEDYFKCNDLDWNTKTQCN